MFTAALAAAALGRYRLRDFRDHVVEEKLGEKVAECPLFIRMSVKGSQTISA